MVQLADATGRGVIQYAKDFAWIPPMEHEYDGASQLTCLESSSGWIDHQANSCTVKAVSLDQQTAQVTAATADAADLLYAVCVYERSSCGCSYTSCSVLHQSSNNCGNQKSTATRQ